jgi:hypothetical protein
MDKLTTSAVTSAVTALAAIIIIFLLPVPTVAVPLFHIVLQHDGLIGGILAFVGALIAGYWAFVAASENNRSLVRVENLKRNGEFARDIRDQLAYARRIIFPVKSDLSNYIMRKADGYGFPEEGRDVVGSITSIQRPEIKSILPNLVEYELNAAVNLIHSSASMLKELYSQESLLAGWAQQGIPRKPFLAYNIDQVKEFIAATDIKLRIIEKFYYAFRHRDKTELPVIDVPHEEIDNIARVYGWSGADLLAKLRKRSANAAASVKDDETEEWQKILRSELIK